MNKNIFYVTIAFIIVLIVSPSIFSQVIIEKKNSNKDKSGKQTSQNDSSKTKMNTYQIEQDLLELLNEKRKEFKLKPLIWNEQIAKVSRQHSESMSKKNFFSIKGIDGKTVKEQAKEAKIINWTNFGRMVSATTDSEEVAKKTITRWFSSEPRKLYLLNSVWQQTGFGVFINENGKIFITQDLLGN